MNQVKAYVDEKTSAFNGDIVEISDRILFMIETDTDFLNRISALETGSGTTEGITYAQM